MGAALARTLNETLRSITADALLPQLDLSAMSRVEDVLMQAEELGSLTLEASGLVREVARLAFLRGTGVAPLRRLAGGAWKRWLGRRAEAAAGNAAVNMA